MAIAGEQAHAMKASIAEIGSPSGSPGRPLLAYVGLSRLTDRGILVLLLVGVAAVGWPSLSTLLPAAAGDTPVSFVPLVPFIGAFFLVALCDGGRIHSAPRDGFVDGFSGLLLAVATLAVLLVLPTSMSWYYWLDRLDVVGLILVLTTLVVIVWGLPGVVQLGPGLAYLFLAWPLPYLQLYNRIIPTLTEATAVATRTIKRKKKR